MKFRIGKKILTINWLAIINLFLKGFFFAMGVISVICSLIILMGEMA